MFRMPGLPQIDPAEEKRRVRENIKSNIFAFVVFCGVIRIAPLIMDSLLTKNV